MSVRMTQAGVILALLRIRPQGITPLDALNELGCMRLAARIRDLREQGHHIRMTRESRNGKSYARYQLVPPPPPMPELEQRAMWGDR